MSRLQIGYDHFSPSAAFQAGETFRRYQAAGGPRQHLVPDFLIAAHTMSQADRLAAVDRGYLRVWFPQLISSVNRSGILPGTLMDLYTK
ncbi:MAG: hypothetical protein NT069_06700 [Planctomycetota bacterium]|nr:hypothetical protein [Planctomycetota bacterium]